MASVTALKLRFVLTPLRPRAFAPWRVYQAPVMSCAPARVARRSLRVAPSHPPGIHGVCVTAAPSPHCRTRGHDAGAVGSDQQGNSIRPEPRRGGQNYGNKIMNEVIRGYWENAYLNDDFICVETWSGYRGGHRGDPKGKQNFVAPDASDEALGAAVLDALAHSRWVLGAPRDGFVDPPGLEYDMELYDYKQTAEQYIQWIKNLMERYSYKTKRALFKDLENCRIAVKGGVMKITPMRHTKLEQWEGLGPNDEGSIEIPADSTPVEIGSAVRLAFSRCVG